jgi:MFS family permease
MSLLPGTPALRGKAGAITFGLVGYLVLVEIVSGILQGYYVPLITDLVTYLNISDADFNWFEAAQLLISALVVPVLAKLGDMYGHKKILLISTVLTAMASWGLVLADNFVGFLIAWALQAFYVVWLPLEVALIFDRGRRTGRGASQTRKAAGFLIVALQSGAIVGALLGGRVLGWTNENVPVTLMIPAIAVTLVFFVILFGVPESSPLPGRSLDLTGFSILTIGLLFITSGLTFLRLNGLEAWWAYLLIAGGIATFIPFSRFELRQADPAIDLRVLLQPNMWPVQLTAFLIGISLLGAQAPLSAYAGTDPSNGYGLGLDSTDRSTLIGVYLISMIGGALLFPLVSRWRSPRVALIIAAFFVAAGYLLFIPFHLEIWQVFVNMFIAGIGSGALVGAMPAAAAAAAPRGQTGVAAALTNATKTIGGSFASAIFAIVLTMGVVSVIGSTASSLSGYMTVWSICGIGALLAAVLLFLVPKLAFADIDDALESGELSGAPTLP